MSGDALVMHKVVKRFLLDPPYDTVAYKRRVRIVYVETVEEPDKLLYVRVIGNPLSKHGIVVGSCDQRFLSVEEMDALTRRVADV